MKLLYFFSVSLLSLMLSFCSSSSGGKQSSDAVLAEESASMKTQPAEYDNPESEMPAYERKLTKNGTIRFETSNMQKTKQLIANAVTQMKGYISSDNVSEYNKQTENTLTIRVPANNTDSLIAVIESSASKIDYKSIDVQDVTEQFIDLDTRVKTKKEVEARYRELLARASSVEEILKIEEQIGNIRAEIDSAEGRLKYLSNQVQFSTLNVTFYEKYSDFGFWGKMGKAFKNGWNGLLWLLVGIANLWAIILFIAFAVFIILYVTKKYKSKKLPPFQKK